MKNMKLMNSMSIRAGVLGNVPLKITVPPSIKQTKNKSVVFRLIYFITEVRKY